MRNKINIATLLILFSGLLLSSCIKDDVKDLGDAGKTFVKILEAPEKKFFFEPFSTTNQVNLFSLRRDANSNASLNETVTVTLRVDTAALRAYNASHNSSFELLPDSLFTVPAGFTKSGPLTYTTTFGPGEFAKEFTIGLNGSKWDLSKTYAMPMMIQNAGNVAISSEMNNIVSTISIKNRFDGRYKMNGTLTDLAVGSLTMPNPDWEVWLLTTGPNSVRMYNAATGISSFKDLFPIKNGPDESAYGAFLPVFTIDANNNVTSVTNFYGQPASNTRSAQLDPTGVNKWDPATKTLRVKFFMFQPSAVPSGPRATIDLTLNYLGPR